MIDINLLPQSARKQSSLSSLSIDIPPEISLGLGGSFIILLIVSNIILLAFCGFFSFQSNVKKSEWEKMQSSRKLIDDINKELKDVNDKKSSIKKATISKHTKWSMRLNYLSDSIVKGMWLKRVTFDGKTILIEGYAVSKLQSDMMTLNAFVTNLKKDTAFMADIASIDVNNVIKEKRGMVDIAKFSITAKLN